MFKGGFFIIILVYMLFSFIFFYEIIKILLIKLKIIKWKLKDMIESKIIHSIPNNFFYSI